MTDFSRRSITVPDCSTCAGDKGCCSNFKTAVEAGIMEQSPRRGGLNLAFEDVKPIKNGSKDKPAIGGNSGFGS